MSSPPLKPIPSPPALGANLKLLRQKRGVSLTALAKRAGVSKAMLSQVEQGKTNPTVATVWKISYALGSSFREMFNTGTEHVFEVLRERDAVVVAERKGMYKVRVVSPVHMVEDVEVYVLTFSPGGELKSQPHYSGTMELLTIIKGRFHVHSGKETARLEPGDSVRYAADCPHTIACVGKTAGMLLMVVKFAK